MNVLYCSSYIGGRRWRQVVRGSQITVCIFALAGLGGCAEQLAWGFVNKRSGRVIIVEREGSEEVRHTLEPFKALRPGVGPNLPFVLFGADGVLIGRYKPSQLPITGDDPVSYIVITEHGLRVEPENIALRDVTGFAQH